MSRPPVALRGGVALALLLALSAGCKGKVDQCNAFVDEANAGQSSYIGLEAVVGNPDALTKRADALDASAKRLRAITLSDAKLVDLRDRYASATDGYSAGLKKLAAAPKDDPSASLAVEQDLDVVADKQQKLIQEINGYCGGH